MEGKMNRASAVSAIGIVVCAGMATSLGLLYRAPADVMPSADDAAAAHWAGARLAVGMTEREALQAVHALAVSGASGTSLRRYWQRRSEERPAWTVSCAFHADQAGELRLESWRADT